MVDENTGRFCGGEEVCMVVMWVTGTDGAVDRSK
jgi:hypothetical protein